MNPWIKSGVCLLMRNAVRAGVYKRSGQEPCLRNIPIEDIAGEALGPHLLELHYEIAFMSQKAYRMKITARGNETQEADANLLEEIAGAGERLIKDYQAEQSRKTWGMF